MIVAPEENSTLLSRVINRPRYQPTHLAWYRRTQTHLGQSERHGQATSEDASLFFTPRWPHANSTHRHFMSAHGRHHSQQHSQGCTIHNPIYCPHYQSLYTYIYIYYIICRIISCLKGFTLFIIFQTHIECICRWKVIKK